MARMSYRIVEREPPAFQLPSLLNVRSLDEIINWMRVFYDVFLESLNYSRECGAIANSAMHGKTNNVGDVSLTASATSTTLTDALIGPDSFIGFTPLTANAAAALADANFYISGRTNGSCTINHDSTAQDDQNLTYVVIG